jgi:hypothetical protein
VTPPKHCLARVVRESPKATRTEAIRQPPAISGKHEKPDKSFPVKPALLNESGLRFFVVLLPP